jgi:RNA polymerase sigma-70 factor (ECF subfamily)
MTEALYRQHAPFVAGFLARLGVAARHVDDEVLRVFAEVHRQSACAPSAASMKAWIAVVALRSATRRFHLGRVELPAARGDGSSDPSVEQFLFSLEPELRAIFVLFELEGEPSEAIAAAFGLTLETVHARLHEGQREFRRAFRCDAPAPSVEDEGLGLPAFVDPVSLV